MIKHPRISIAFISHFFGIGGIERTFLSIAEQLKYKGYAFHFINLSSPVFQQRFQKCGLCYYSPDYHEVIQYLRDNQVAIVQTGNCDEGSYLAYLAGVPVIVERPDGFSSAFLSDKTPVDAVICSTRKVAEKVQELYPHKYSRLIFNGVDTRRFQPRCYLLQRRQHDISEDAVIIGYCGRIAEEKCIDKLIEVFARTLQSHERAFLIIAGSEHRPEDGYRDRLLEQIHTLHISHAVRFMEPTEKPEELYPLFDIAVLSSGSFYQEGVGYVTEGVPNAVMEAMSCSLPIMATDSGETSALVRNGENGFIVDVNDWEGFQEKLSLLIVNTALRMTMGRKSRAIVENEFTIEAMVDSYEEMYEYTCSDLFRNKYPNRRHGMDEHFLSHPFAWTDPGHKKISILLIRSASDAITSGIYNDIHKKLRSYSLSVFCHESHLENTAQYTHIKDIFSFSGTPRFEIQRLRTHIDHIRSKKFDYVIFGINDLLGKEYENVFECIQAIGHHNTIIVNRLNRKFRFPIN
ncbi:MAG: glycosyltransferase family 4 protein [Candidatus Auribacterota bacterium]